ncbi:MAG: glycosyltransferase family 39 protein [Gemmataceae bacterium]|nr:glycosyltransferase family 39 protein [Gemmataceae bacterium]
MAPPTYTADAPPARLAPRVRRVQILVAPSAARGRMSPGLAAGLLIAGWVVLNLAYLLIDCPLDLSADEAHYWHWSRHLDWSYYSKGPLVAWLIRGGCELFGPTPFAVRLPAVLSSAALLAGLYRLGADAFRSTRVGLATVALAMTLPPVAAGAVVMTIDPPFLACWCWALVAVMRAVERGRAWWWLLAGVCCGLGVLAKYTMLLFPVAVAGFLLAHRRHEFRRPGFWLMFALTTAGCLPILIWNAGNGWVSARHVFGQAGVTAAGVRWLGPPEFAAGQFGLLLGFWFVAFAAAGWRYAPHRPGGPCHHLLWWMSVPVWLVFFAASLRNPGQANWPAAAYVGGLVLAVGWVRDHLHRRAVRVGLVVAVVVGLGSSVALRFPGLTRPILSTLAGPSTDADPTPVRKLDPTARLRGWRALAAELDRVRGRVRSETGTDPVLAGMRWTVPGELSFYCQGHPEAYSFGPALADRHSQYDLWRPNPTADAQAFRGRSFVYVGDEIPDARAVFERVEPPIRVVYAEAGVPVAVWTIWVGHGFRGFPEPRAAAGY